MSVHRNRLSTERGHRHKLDRCRQCNLLHGCWEGCSRCATDNPRLGYDYFHIIALRAGLHFCRLVIGQKPVKRELQDTVRLGVKRNVCNNISNWDMAGV